MTSARVLFLTGKQPGVNTDLVDVAAGMSELAACGWVNEPFTEIVINYSLLLWRRGEEESAERAAIDQDFHGIDLTSWRRILAAAVAAGNERRAV